MLTAIREMQLPLVAVMLLGGCLTKLTRALRTGSVDAGLGPTALFPMRMRRPVAMSLSAIEFGFGLGLIITAWGVGATATATCVRLGTGLLFLVATSALIELRAVRPDVGCGCFGDFSKAPVSGRTIARSALLAAAALSTIGVPRIAVPRTGGAGLELLAFLCVELLVFGALSPELGEGLIRLGYSEPCELRDVPSARTIATLRRSKQWRRNAGLLAADTPVDMWRELCWRYVVYPSSYPDRQADIIFAVYLQHRRPVIHAALVDSGTGLRLPWPGGPRPTGPRLTGPRPAAPRPTTPRPPRAALPQPIPPQATSSSQPASGRVPAGLAVTPPPPQADLPLSTDL